MHRNLRNSRENKHTKKNTFEAKLIESEFWLKKNKLD